LKQYTALVLTIFFSTIAFGMKKNEEPVSLIKTKRVLVCPQPNRCIPGVTIDFSELLSEEEKYSQFYPEVRVYTKAPEEYYQSQNTVVWSKLPPILEQSTQFYNLWIAENRFNEWKLQRNK